MKNTQTTFSPGIISLLPIFYVGWADSVLSPTELSKIQEIIAEMDFLQDFERQQLLAWTDRSNPPTADDFKHWLDAIKTEMKAKGINEKMSLVRLGIELAKVNGDFKQAQTWDSPQIKEHIEALEMALGVSNQGSKATFYQAVGFEINEKSDAVFSTKTMQQILDGPHAEIKLKAKNLLKDPFFKIKYDVRDKSELREIVLTQCRELAKQGFGAYAYPIEYGGHASPGGNTAIFETLAMGNLSLLVKFGVQFGLFGGAVLQLGTKKHHDLYLTNTGSLALAGCFAMTETGHGSNVKDLETTTTYNHETRMLTVHSPTLTAGKEYIGNAMHATMAAVFTQLVVNGKNHGIHAVLVPLRDANHELLPGVTVEDCGYKVGLNGVDNGRIWFENVQIPVENLLNKYGGIDEAGNYFSSIESESKRFFTMLGALVGGRVSVALASNQATKKALDIAIRYATKRRQFNNGAGDAETLILDYPTHQWRLFPRLAKAYALTFALENLREKFEENYASEDKREVEALAAGLKSYASWFATDTIQECREACGGKGYLAENEFADLKADTDIFTTFEGDNHVLLQLVAKSILTDLKKEFNDDGFWAVARHAYKRVGNSLATMNPSLKSNDNAEHLLSTAFMKEAFSFRTESLLYSLSDRMRNLMGKKLHPSDIFFRVQTHMVALAKVYVEQHIFDQFVLKYNSLADSNEKKTLLLMLQTYGLHTLYEDRAWFLENDYFSGEKSKAIRKILDSLMKQIRPVAVDLVDAFGIPAVLRRAKIAE